MLYWLHASLLRRWVKDQVLQALSLPQVHVQGHQVLESFLAVGTRVVGGPGVREHVLLHVAAVQRRLGADQAPEVPLPVFRKSGNQKLHHIAYRKTDKNRY